MGGGGQQDTCRGQAPHHEFLPSSRESLLDSRHGQRLGEAWGWPSPWRHLVAQSVLLATGVRGPLCSLSGIPLSFPPSLPPVGTAFLGLIQARKHKAPTALAAHCGLRTLEAGQGLAPGPGWWR